MALSKEQVKHAKLKILSRQQYPSVDAVRIELGNTGSKSTIHKYLKELEQEDEKRGSATINLSETIQNFVAQLAKQLHAEADQRIHEQLILFEEKEKIAQEELERLKQSNKQLQQDLDNAKQYLKLLDQQLSEKNELYQNGQIERQKYEQQAHDLKLQLKQSDQHRADLMNKFNHAQQSLEHYRESVKEQRQQEMRRHDTAIQHLQHEIRQLQQTIVVEKQKNNQLNITLNVLESEKVHTQQMIERYLDDIANLKDSHTIVQSNYNHVIKQYDDFKVEATNTIAELKAQIRQHELQKCTYDDYDELKQHNIRLATELKLIQKMYNELIASLSVAKIKKEE